jgi:RsiW-degrading membrane proteinase PrsW (M82 family)
MTAPHLPPPGSPGNSISFTTLFPWMGDRSQLAGKGYLVPALVTVISAIAISGAASGAFSFIVLPYREDLNSAIQVCWILALYFAIMSVWAVYMLCGRSKPWWLLPSVGIVVFELLWYPELLEVLSWPFDYLLRAKALIASSDPLAKSLGAFLGPGLSEELFKALPVIALGVLAVYGKGPLAKRMGVWEPLDGILVGVTSGAAFTLSEASSYMISSMSKVLGALSTRADELSTEMTKHLSTMIGQDLPRSTIEQFVHSFSSEMGGAAASYYGLLQILFRSIVDLGGHMAYAGIFGYFIGLAVMRRGAAPRLLLLGWISAAALHGVWDAIAFSAPQTAIRYACFAIIATLSYGWLAAAILKARKISPTRHENFATIVLPSAARTPARPGPVPTPAQAGGASPRMGGAQVQAAPSAARPRLTMKIGSGVYVMKSGFQIEPKNLGAAGAGRGKGPIAEVVPNPSDPTALGLRNVSQKSYRVRYSGGRIVDFHPQQTVPLAEDTVIDFGGAEGVVQQI